MSAADRDVASIDAATLSQDERLTLLRDVECQIARFQAAKMRVLHALIDAPGDTPAPNLDKQWIREEISCVLRVPAVTAATQMSTASELAERLPNTLQALAAGLLTLGHAEKLADAVAPLSDHDAAKVEREVLPNAASQSTTQFAASVRRMIVKVDPRSMAQRRRDGVERRRIVFSPQDDAMTEIWASLPSEHAAAVRTRVCELAEQWQMLDKKNGRERTADQRRADAFMTLVLDGDGLGGPPNRSEGLGMSLRPLVRITVALSTLLGLDEQPADLDGAGPIPADVARRLAEDPTGVWRRLVTDSCGTVIDAARTYRPPAPIAGAVRANWRTCCFPGCRRPAAACELDHVVAWAEGGVTSSGNLQPLCARHHHAKHEGGWRVRRLRNGTTRWTSPHGRRHDRPPDDPLPHDTTMSRRHDPE